MVGIIEILDLLQLFLNYKFIASVNCDQFLYEIIIPLHKQKYLIFFHSRLISFILFWINFFPVSISNIILNIIQITPKDSRNGLLIKELNQLVLLDDFKSLDLIYPKIHKIIISCFNSHNIDVCN
ncbi:hypothetical protein HZS_1469 [Henneguya salminicola]|nr:hypothetical protein HZS_1469 [Henneguya salminicola]